MTIILQESKDGTDTEVAKLTLDPTSEVGTWMKTSQAWPEFLIVREHGAFSLVDWDASEQAWYVRTSGFVI